MKQYYDLIFSVGAGCSCSSCLRNANLQFATYPFDWLYGADIQDRISLLCSGFEDWLDKDCLVNIGKREHPVPCDIYRNTKTNIVFNHDFPKGEDFDKSYIQVCEKYNRRIERLIKTINDAKKVLAVYIQLPNDVDIENKMLLESKSLLDETFGKGKIDILCFQYKADIALENLEIQMIGEGIKIVCYDFKSKSNNTEGWKIDNNVMSNWLRENYCSKDHRKMWQKIIYYYNRKKKYLNDFGNSFPEQLINNIQYKIWKHLGKNLSKRGLI